MPENDDFRESINTQLRLIHDTMSKLADKFDVLDRRLDNERERAAGERADFANLKSLVYSMSAFVLVLTLLHAPEVLHYLRG